MAGMDGVHMFGFGTKRTPAAWEGHAVSEIVPSRRVAHEDTPDRGIRLLDPRFKGAILGRLLQPRLPAHRAHVKVDLDDRGCLIWRSIDGVRTVADLAKLFETAYPEDADQAQERVWRYVAVMEHHGFVDLDLKP